MDEGEVFLQLAEDLMEVSNSLIMIGRRVERLQNRFANTFCNYSAARKEAAHQTTGGCPAQAGANAGAAPEIVNHGTDKEENKS